MSNKIIALEGISGSGKSTLIDKVITRYNWSLLYELPDKYDPITEFPRFTIDTRKAIKANGWFIQKEIERCAEARRLQQTNNVVADRWYFSIFSVSYARHKLFGTQDTDDLENSVEKLLVEGKLFIPDVYIVDVPLNLALDRLYKSFKGDTNKMRILNLYEEFLKEQKEYYALLAREKSFPTILMEEKKNFLLSIQKKK